MKEWKSTSPSQIATHRMCPRKWWWTKIGGLSRPSSPAALLGSKKHALLESYFKRQSALTDHRLIPGLVYLPNPIEINPAGVELRIKFSAEDLPVPINGVIDLVEHLTGTITDHKTTSNFRYARSEEELRHDPQAIIYSRFALTFITEFQKLDKIKFRHIYYRTKGAAASLERSVTFTRDELKQSWSGIVSSSDQMLAHSKLPVEQVPYKLTACSAYGGCPFRVHCAKAGADTLGSVGRMLAAHTGDHQMPTPTKANAFAARLAARHSNGTAASYQGWFAAKGHPQPPEMFQGHQQAIEWGNTHLADDETTKKQYRTIYDATASQVGQQPTMRQLSEAWIKHVRDQVIKSERPNQQASLDWHQGAKPTAGINPPDGNSATAPPPPLKQHTSKGKGKGKAPWLPDGSSARSLKKTQLFATVSDIFKGLDADQQARFLAPLNTNEQAWFKTSCPNDRTKRIVVINCFVAPLTAIATGGEIHPEALPEQPGTIWNSVARPAVEPELEPAVEPKLEPAVVGRYGKESTDVDHWIEDHRNDKDPDVDLFTVIMSLSYDHDDNEGAAAIIKCYERNRFLVKENSKVLRALEKAYNEADRLHAEKDQMSPVSMRKRLYIDCQPTTGPRPTSFDQWIEPYQAEAAKIGGVANWLMLDFGKGPRFVAAAVEAAIATSRSVLPDSMTISSNSTSAQGVIDVLRRHYDDIIKG